jgi:hypothetical protein
MAGVMRDVLSLASVPEYKQRIAFHDWMMKAPNLGRDVLDLRSHEQYSIDEAQWELMVRSPSGTYINRIDHCRLA